MQKLIGSGMIIIATTSFGLTFISEYKKRLNTLIKLVSLFTSLRNEISYNFEELSNVCINVSKIDTEKNSEVNHFFLNIGSGLKSKETSDMKQLWKTQVYFLAKKTKMTKQDTDKLILLGETIGGLDINHQLSRINLYIDSVNNDIEMLTKECEKIQKLYTSLGIISGLFITILLV